MVCRAILLSPVETVQFGWAFFSNLPAPLAPQHLVRTACPVSSLYRDAEKIECHREGFLSGRKTPLCAVRVPALAADGGRDSRCLPARREKIIVGHRAAALLSALGHPLSVRAVRAPGRPGNRFAGEAAINRLSRGTGLRL